MYAAHYNLREPPFSIAPDPAYLYMSARHQEALGHLLYGTGQYGGFVQLTGEVGTGKTTIVRTLLAQKLANVDIAMIHNPRQTEIEFVASICDELGVSYGGSASQPATSIKTVVDALNEHLLKTHAAGCRTVLIIDEAQNLSQPVLEQVRLLTNLETDKEKLLRIMLIGQPELVEMLARPDLRQLNSRITARFHLTPLSLNETFQYIIHRLHVAGGASDLFGASAMKRVHQYARGIPRQINIICDRALLGAYAGGLRTVTPAIVDQAAVEVFGTQPRRASPSQVLGGLIPKKLPLPWVEGALAIAALLVAGVLLNQALGTRPAVPQAVAIPTPAPVIEAPTAPSPAPTVGQSETDPLDAGVGALRATAEPLPAVTARLIGLWQPKLQIERGANVCRALLEQGLDCYKDNGRWDDLKLMNRPAILTLAMEDSSQQHVLLRRIDGDAVVLETANGPLRMKLDQLNPLWSGEFLLLWQHQTPELRIDAQTKGDSVVWLRRALAQVDGKPLTGPVPNNFGPELRSQLVRFQSAHGVEANGVADVRTLVALASIMRKPAEPILVETP